jgi:DNA replication protein DnaD
MDNSLAEIQNSWLWQDRPFAKGQAWIDLLLMADSDSIFFRGKIYNCSPGELITSEQELGKRWGWSRTKIRSFLQVLSQDSMIKLEVSRSKTSITISNYPEQTIEKPYPEPDKGQKKGQVEIQPNYTDNQVNSEDQVQEKKQVKIQNKDKITDNARTEKCSQILQRSIFDEIKENS